MDISIEPGMLAQIIMMGHELDRAEDELRGIVDRLSEDQQAELIAIMWVGRGSFDAAEWDEALQTAMQEATTPCIEYLLGTPHFPDHLEAGSEALGVQIELDEMTSF